MPVDGDADAIARRLTEEGWVLRPDDGFIGLIGPLWQLDRPGVNRFGLWADGRHRNRREVVHGGALLAIADRAMGSTARSHDTTVPTATIQLSMNFISAAHVGAFIEVDCVVERAARSVAFVSSRLEQEGRLVATATGVWKLIGR